MSRTATVLPSPKHAARRNTSRAQQLAQTAADRYFGAIAAEIPFDNAPGDVDLISAVNDIQDARLRESKITGGSQITDVFDKRESAALHAGYLLGVEIGRRIAGGVR